MTSRIRNMPQRQRILFLLVTFAILILCLLITRLLLVRFGGSSAAAPLSVVADAAPPEGADPITDPPSPNDEGDNANGNVVQAEATPTDQATNTPEPIDTPTAIIEPTEAPPEDEPAADTNLTETTSDMAPTVTPEPESEPEDTPTPIPEADANGDTGNTDLAAVSDAQDENTDNSSTDNNESDSTDSNSSGSENTSVDNSKPSSDESGDQTVIAQATPVNRIPDTGVGTAEGASFLLTGLTVIFFIVTGIEIKGRRKRRRRMNY